MLEGLEATDPEGRSFSRKVLIAVGITVAVLGLLWVLASITGVLMLVFAAVLLAVIFSGAAEALSSRTPLPYGGALAIVLVLIFGGLTLVGYFLAPRIAAQLDQLTETIPTSYDQIEQSLSRYSWGEFLVKQIPESPGSMISGSGNLWTRVTGVFSTLLGILTNVLLLLVISVFLAVNPSKYRKGLVKLVPKRARPRADEVLGDAGDALWGWLTGQFISMTIIGVMTWLGLMLLGMPLALSLGFLAGLFEFVPLIGPWIGAVPGVLIAFLEGPQQALYVAGVYLVIQQLESNLITPVVMKHAVELPPALTLVATVVAGVLFGLPGILLATPLLVVVKLLVEKLYVEDVLGDHSGS